MFRSYFQKALISKSTYYVPNLWEELSAAQNASTNNRFFSSPCSKAVIARAAKQSPDIKQMPAIEKLIKVIFLEVRLNTGGNLVADLSPKSSATDQGDVLIKKGYAIKLLIIINLRLKL